MHPDLIKISDELNAMGDERHLALRFGLACVEDVAGNLENEDVIAVLERFRRCVNEFGPPIEVEINELASTITQLASSHPGSKSIDGTRHAAVSATYALAKAVHGQAVDAAAYAAYSYVYGYGSYAVSDPESFSEIHRRQYDHLRRLKLSVSRV